MYEVENNFNQDITHDNFKSREPQSNIRNVFSKLECKYFITQQKNLAKFKKRITPMQTF